MSKNTSLKQVLQQDVGLYPAIWRPVVAQNSAVQKIGEDLSEMRSNRHVKFHADW